jgi:hypothetical protein
MMRNFKISGAPTNPERIDLLPGDELGMWQATSGYGWAKRGEELYCLVQRPASQMGLRQTTARQRFTESAVHYLRPLLEDGAIEYEFFYDPDKAATYPMLDRLTFLLEPDGVKLHWLTDGRSETSKVPFDNVQAEPACCRGPSQIPLKPRAWNKVRLAVAGDVVRIALNGTEIYERTIEPTNQRQFGLFHYADRTDARARGITHVGAWPKKLPPQEEWFKVKD